MESDRSKILRKYLPLSLFAIYLILHVILSFRGWVEPFELFNLLLLSAALISACMLTFGNRDLMIGLGIIIIIASHGLIGQKLAPDSLTSGAILMINILILYVGFKIYEHLSLTHFVVFAGSYFLLFFIFIMQMDNAEALFLLSLMGLAATARSFKLTAYFWALVLSFTFCQPYSWQAVLILFFFLKIMFSLKNPNMSMASVLFLACGMLLVFLVLLPVLVLVLGEDPRNIISMLKQENVRKALLMTGLTATISTGVLAIFCVPFAYAVSRMEFFGKAFLLSLIDLPIVIPQSAAGIALLGVFSRQQFLGETLYNFMGIRFDGTMLGICLAQIFVAMPFITKASLSAFESVPTGLEQSARTLGASSFGVFSRIALPLAAKGVFAGVVLAWARAAGEFGAVLFVAPYPETAPVAVYNRFTSVGIVETAPLVTTLLLFSVLLFFLLQFASRLMPGTGRKENV
jgi:molybdate/tungstate transport system permease protein